VNLTAKLNSVIELNSMRPLHLHTPVGIGHAVESWARRQVTPTAEAHIEAARASERRDRLWQDPARAGAFAARGDMVERSTDTRRKARKELAAIRVALATIKAIDKELAADYEEDDFEEGEREALEAERAEASWLVHKASERLAQRAPRKARRAAVALLPKAQRREVWAQHVKTFARAS
jgi:hypothetical protein